VHIRRKEKNITKLTNQHAILHVKTASHHTSVIIWHSKYYKTAFWKVLS